jgi:hypothetical protein
MILAKGSVGEFCRLSVPFFRRPMQAAPNILVSNIVELQLSDLREKFETPCKTNFFHRAKSLFRMFWLCAENKMAGSPIGVKMYKSVDGAADRLCRGAKAMTHWIMKKTGEETVGNYA